LWVERFEFAEESGIETEAKFGVHSALQQELAATAGHQFVNLGFVLFEGGDVGVFVLASAEKIAELATRHTDIGVVHIAVNEPCDFVVRVKALPNLVSDKHQLGGAGLCIEQQPFFEGERISLQGLDEKFLVGHVQIML